MASYDQNWRGSGLGEHPKIREPLFISTTVKLATSNLVYNLGLGSSLPRNNFYDENWQGARLGEHPKILEPLFLSAITKVGNFKFGIQLGLGE